MKNSSAALLKNALLTNAVFSTLGGIVCLTANDLLTEFMGVANGLYLYILGVGLVIFGLDVAFTATRKTLNPLFIKMIIGADISWVVASILLITLMPQLFSFTGIVLIEVVALAVGVFAVLQTIGLKRISPRQQLAT